MKHYKRLIHALIVFTLSASSCTTIIFQKIGFEDYYKIILNKKDNTFTEYLQYMNLKDTFLGTWKKHKDTIILSIESPEIFSFTDSNAIIIESYQPKNDSTIFKANKFVNIFLNNESINSYSSDSNGYVRIKTINLKKFTVSAIGSSVSYKIKDTTSNYFEIFTNHDIPVDASILRIDPVMKYILKINRLIPIIGDSTRNEFALKRKWQKVN